MKTIRNSVFIGASLLGGCTSVENYFDALRVARVKDAIIEKGAHYTPKALIALIALTKPIFRGFSWGF
ncbi:urease-enhancing factor [Helicobacter pylori]|nr:urease-enhancing factor [Helicobacter pylori]BAW41143.1 urease-enhancing factor [Helicobacter pylori]